MAAVCQIKVAAFSGGRAVPSARFRVRQYIDDLRAQQICLDEYHPVVGDAYPPVGLAHRIPWLGSQLQQRLWQVRSSRGHDLTVLQRQMVSTINTWEWMTGKPRLLDVDDAIWLSARLGSVDRLARNCDGIICGNRWLADYFSKHNGSIHVIPTAVDTRVWVPRATYPQDGRRVLGWIGTQSNLRYLYGIERALARVLECIPDLDVMVISDKAPAFEHLPSTRVTYRPWQEVREVADVQAMTVGLMPLEDGPWARGKCSFKMLQYMACGVPAVVSPVGMNTEVAAHGGALLARTEDDWADALLMLLKDDDLWRRLSLQARAVVQKHYATPVIAADLARTYRHYV